MLGRAAEWFLVVRGRAAGRFVVVMKSCCMVCGCYEELLNGLWLLGRAAELFVVVRKSWWMLVVIGKSCWLDACC